MEYTVIAEIIKGASLRACLPAKGGKFILKNKHAIDEAIWQKIMLISAFCLGDCFTFIASIFYISKRSQ
jgi:hypothetical protein